ncbi:MAG: amidohydrolase family protein [Paracoccaceae bacterium]
MHADLILTNARIRTMDTARPFAEAIAIANGRILAVGSAGDIAALAGPGTRVHNLHGRAVMPGLIDSHTHGLWGATRDTLEVFTGFASSHAQLLDAIRDRAATLPPGTWIAAGPWKLHLRPELGARPADLLDKAAPDHPVAIKDITHHAIWLNSAALAAAGITASTPNPEGGEIERDIAGQPTGILRETAMALALPFIAHSPENLAKAVRHMVRYFNAQGITGFKEPMAFEPDLRAYSQSRRRGRTDLAHGRPSCPTIALWRRVHPDGNPAGLARTLRPPAPENRLCQAVSGWRRPQPYGCLP